MENTECDERVRQIRERWPKGTKDDIEFLLSLLDSQAALRSRHAEEIAADIVRERSEHDMNENYGSDYLQDEFGAGRLEERIALALINAATRMRDRCVEKVREMGQQWYGEAKKRGAAFSDKGRIAETIAKELESLTLEREQEKQR